MVVGGTAQTQAAVQALVKRLDVPPRQVDVSVEIASIDDSLLKQTGIEYNWSTVEGGAAHSIFSLSGTIHALEERGKAKILARPHIVASNGREAHILIGDKIPVQTEHRSGQETAISTTYEDAGIKLTYTPQVHPDNSVTADLFAEVSTPVFVPELKLTALRPVRLGRRCAFRKGSLSLSAASFAVKTLSIFEKSRFWQTCL